MQRKITKKKNDDDVTSSSSSSSKAPCAASAAILHLQTTLVNPVKPVDILEQELMDLGFDGPMSLIQQYGYDRVKAAKDRAISRPPGLIKNLPGYIRYLCKSKGPIPAPNGDKYVRGKLAKVVQR